MPCSESGTDPHPFGENDVLKLHRDVVLRLEPQPDGLVFPMHQLDRLKCLVLQQFLHFGIGQALHPLGFFVGIAVDEDWLEQNLNRT